MKTDKELLELAAKAVGIEIVQPLYTDDTYSEISVLEIWNKGRYEKWNPLEDDGDAFRLAIRLNLDILNCNGSTSVNNGHSDYFINETDLTNPFAATRRAIVRAAAEMVKETS